MAHNIPPALPRLTAADANCTCEMCHRDCTQWPTGLVCIDREISLFGGDFRACPDCTPASVAGLIPFLDEGVELAYIDYYWFEQDDIPEGA